MKQNVGYYGGTSEQLMNSKVRKTYVLMSYYKQKNYLKKVLQGYKNQSDKNFAIILCNDDITFDAQDICTASKLEIHIINNQRKTGYNLAKIWNDGIRYVEHIASYPVYQLRFIFTNADVYPCDKFIENHIVYGVAPNLVLGGYIHRIVEPMVQNILSNDYSEESFYKFSNPDRKINEWFPYFASKGPIVFDKISGGNFSISYELFYKAGMFDEKFPDYGGEENDLCMKIWKEFNTEFCISDLCRAYHFNHPDTNKNRGDSISKQYLFGKWGLTRQSWLKEVETHRQEIFAKYRIF